MAACNGRSHRTLHFLADSANGGLQCTSITGPENRQRWVWVVSAASVCKKRQSRYRSSNCLPPRVSCLGVGRARWKTFERQTSDQLFMPAEQSVDGCIPFRAQAEANGDGPRIAARLNTSGRLASVRGGDTSDAIGGLLADSVSGGAIPIRDWRRSLHRATRP